MTLIGSVLWCLLLVAGTVSCVLAQEAGDARAQPRSLNQAGFPRELYRRVIAADNPQAAAKVALGKELFFDQRLSQDDTVACASCHPPARGFSDQRAASEGIHHRFDRRNAPSLLNSAFNTVQFWDGREPTLEEQVRDPLADPAEMGMESIGEVVDKLGALPEYRREFETVFGGPVTLRGIEMAIAAYERTLVSFDTPFDRFMAGDSRAIGERAKRGWALFKGNARCITCHRWSPAQPLFTDGRFHNIGISAHQANFVPLARKAMAAVARQVAEKKDFPQPAPFTLLSPGGREVKESSHVLSRMRNARIHTKAQPVFFPHPGRDGVQQLHQLAVTADLSELGRFLVTTQPPDLGAFRTPQLRNLLVTEPYFHDGSQATLWEVVEFYNQGGIRNPFLDREIVPLGLSEGEIDDLVAFLASLTSPEYAAPARIEYKRQALHRPQRDRAAAPEVLTRRR
jgi:cytochrome c peroxidase